MQPYLSVTTLDSKEYKYTSFKVKKPDTYLKALWVNNKDFLDNADMPQV